MQDSVDASLASQHSPADSRGEREATSYMHGELNKSRDKSVHEMMTRVIHVASHVSSEDDDAEQIFFSFFYHVFLFRVATYAKIMGTSLLLLLSVCPGSSLIPGFVSLLVSSLLGWQYWKDNIKWPQLLL